MDTNDIQKLDREIRITQADNGYVLEYSGRMVADEDDYNEYFRTTEVFIDLQHLIEKLYELEEVDLSES